MRWFVGRGRRGVALAVVTLVLGPLLVVTPLLGRLLFSGRFANASELLGQSLRNVSLTDLISIIAYRRLAPANGSLQHAPALHCRLSK